jgi:hypothetical protein
MQYIEENKDWYNKNEILKKYPIGATTYKKRIKKLENPIFKDYTRMVEKNLENSNLKKIQIREIHLSILDDLFGKIRLPNKNKKDNVIKWVNNSKWDWFGDIVPCKTRANEIAGKMNFVFSRLKKLYKKSNITIFYSIEKNTNDDYYHAHFVLKDGFEGLSMKKIIEMLELVCEENTGKETRIYLKRYDYKNYGTSGSNYTLKNLEIGYDLLK